MIGNNPRPMKPIVNWTANHHGFVSYKNREYELFQEKETRDWILIWHTNTSSFMERFTRGGYPAVLDWLVYEMRNT